jgi:hypothetical protein
MDTKTYLPTLPLRTQYLPRRLVLQLYYVCTMYTMVYTVTIYILCTEVQYMVHTMVYIVNMVLDFETFKAKRLTV